MLRYWQSPKNNTHTHTATFLTSVTTTEIHLQKELPVWTLFLGKEIWETFSTGIGSILANHQKYSELTTDDSNDGHLSEIQNWPNVVW